MTSGIILPRGPVVAAAEVNAAAPDSRSTDCAAVVGAAREAYVELLQLAVQVGSLESRLFGDLAHVALLAAQQLLEIDALERFACFPQRELEKTRRDFRGKHLVGGSRFAKQPLDQIRGNLAADDLHVR